MLAEMPSHWSVGTRVDKKETLVPVTQYTADQLQGKEVVEQDGSKFVKEIQDKTVYGYKVFRDGVLLGTNIYRNALSPVYIKRDDRTRHHYCIGKSGT